MVGAHLPFCRTVVLQLEPGKQEKRLTCCLLFTIPIPIRHRVWGFIILREHCNPYIGVMVICDLESSNPTPRGHMSAIDVTEGRASLCWIHGPHIKSVHWPVMASPPHKPSNSPMLNEPITATPCAYWRMQNTWQHKGLPVISVPPDAGCI